MRKKLILRANEIERLRDESIEPIFALNGEITLLKRCVNFKKLNEIAHCLEFRLRGNTWDDPCH